MLNIEQDGMPICNIETKTKSRKKTIYVDDKGESMHPFKEFRTNKDERLQQIYPKKGRVISMINGCSGSGKSVYACNLANQYRKQNPENDIYLFSAVKSDPSVDSIKGLRRITLSKFMADEEIGMEDFADSLVIFDDCDTLSDKLEHKKVLALFNKIAQEGRHHDISCIFTSHLACNGAQTKIALAESHTITFFTKTMQGRSLKYLLENYMGLDKEQQKKLKSLDSRAVTWCKTYPQVILSEHEIYVL